MCWALAHKDKNDVYFFDEIVTEKTTTQQCIEELKALKNKHIGKDNMVISSSDLMTILNSDSEELKQYKEVGTVEECRVGDWWKKLLLI